MLLYILLLIIGFVILIYGADFLVKGGSSIAVRLNIPNIVIGLTVVSIGTSAPELVVNIISSVKGESSLAFGNVIGSNIFNILCVLGITAMVFPVDVKKSTTKIEVPLMLFSTFMILVMFGNNHWDQNPHYTIGRIEGIILLIFFFLFIAYTIRLAMKEKEDITIESYSLLKSILFIIGGLTGLLVGGRILVDNAVAIAKAIGISERIIAITIVSVGTSLPELATSIVAARKKNIDMAVGNVVGSNLMNIFMVLGISAVITPISLTIESIVDICIHLIATLLFFSFIFIGKGRRIDRKEGILFFAIYVGYVIYLIVAA